MSGSNSSQILMSLSMSLRDLMDSLVTNLVDLKEHYLRTIQSLVDEMRKAKAVIAAMKGNTGSAAKTQGLLSFGQPLTGGSITRNSDLVDLENRVQVV